MNIKSSKDLVNEANKHIESLDAKKVKLLCEEDKCTLIDVRDIRELWKEGTIKQSIHIPRGMLEFWLDPQSPYYKADKFNGDKKMVLYCALGFRSALATRSLKDMGFKNVANAIGGFEALKSEGLQNEKKEKK